MQIQYNSWFILLIFCLFIHITSYVGIGNFIDYNCRN